MKRIVITGKLATGVGQAAGFTRLDWVRAALWTHFGIDPHPGTVNLLVEDVAAQAGWAAAKSGAAIVLHPPRTDWCDARLWRAVIADRIPAAIVLPEVASYPERQIELVAAIRVRDALRIADGADVSIEVELP